MRIRFLFILGLLSVLSACAHSATATKGARVDTAEPFAQAELPDAERRFLRMAESDPERLDLRDRLIATVLNKAQVLADVGDYEGVVGEVRQLTTYLSPQDYAAGILPKQIEPIATYIADRGGRLGDEGYALAANLILLRLTKDAFYQSRYDTIANWGRESRANLDTVSEQYAGLISVWSRHADLTPAPEVLDTLAELHIGGRDAVAAESTETRHRLGMGAERQLRLAPLNVAAVYLTHGELRNAIAKVESMGGGGELRQRLLELMRAADGSDPSAAAATFELVEGYRVARPEVAAGLCRTSLLRFPADYRFPTCMARVAADAERFADATAWYVIAIDLAPDMIELYDEALGQLDEFIEVRLSDPHPERSSALARGAEKILDERQKRWPTSEPPIAPNRLEFLVGMLEMNAGHADEAQRRFENSIAEDEDPGALLQLGLLLERTGELDLAESRYRRALELTPIDSLPDELRRSEILEHMGDIARARGDDREMTARYQDALKAWTDARDQVEGPTGALVEMRRGVLLDQLGRHEAAVDAFESAMTHAPQWRDVYATILSHLVSATPNFDLASSVWRRSQLQLTLPPEWKVYFTLWMQMIAARAEQAPVKEHTDLLRRLGQSSNWWGKLASFGAGDLDYQDLISVASSLGEETEALYYEATRLFIAGDRQAANEQFRRVLDTKMVSFYEYEMARRLLIEQERDR
ncbi:MAG: tetratricopeptide repeat protein [Deltaproteobacteria bacterium]|jgi:tetratricopeptide (TPR) repeat protein|nr:tetratricopeptide repeat protein [Deltaproteobacteria bacterium]